MKHVELNEGLEILGANTYIDSEQEYSGVFHSSGLESIKLPSTLKRIEYKAFNDCKNLKSIELPGNVDLIGNKCFSSSGIEDIFLHRIPTQISLSAF